MRILQITDPHLYGQPGGRLRGVETDASLRAVVDEALARFPSYSAVLATGDIVHEDPGGYARFRQVFGRWTARCCAFRAITTILAPCSRR